MRNSQFCVNAEARAASGYLRDPLVRQNRISACTVLRINVLVLALGNQTQRISCGWWANPKHTWNQEFNENRTFSLKHSILKATNPRWGTRIQKITMPSFSSLINKSIIYYPIMIYYAIMVTPSLTPPSNYPTSTCISTATPPNLPTHRLQPTPTSPDILLDASHIAAGGARCPSRVVRRRVWASTVIVLDNRGLQGSCRLMRTRSY